MLPARVHRDVGAGAPAVAAVSLRHLLGGIGVQRPDRPTAARSVDEAHDGQTQFTSHLLGPDLLANDGGIGRPATHREVVGGHHHGPAVEVGPAEQEIGRSQVDELAVGVIGGAPGDLPDLVERPVVNHGVDALTNVEFPPAVLAGQLLRAAHLLGQYFPAGQLVQLGLPDARPLAVYGPVSGFVPCTVAHLTVGLVTGH